jgi:WS/DGAT/MGAT family acyltransferase
MVHRMKPSDASFLIIENDVQPCHVANLSTFSLPPDAPANYLRKLVEEMRAVRVFAPPFNYVMRRGVLGKLAPAWEELLPDQIDLDYHFRHSALPEPGGERELGVLVSRLHSHPLDLRRPLWEMHLIEGLENKRFALYLKLHHSQFDGMAGVSLWNRVMSSDPATRGQPPWAVGARGPKKTHAEAKMVAPSTELVSDGGSVVPALKAVRSLFRTDDGLRDPALALPYGTTKTVLNGHISGKRRVATQHYPLERIQRIAKRAEATLNDVFMAICSGALRRYLLEREALPAQTLTTSMPVAIRPQGDASVGNAISFIFAKLGTDIADPKERLELCRDSARLAKAHLQAMPKAALDHYSMIVFGPYLAQVALGVACYTRPPHNLVLSNVAGPRDYLYFNGARMEQCWPVSLLFDGQALNITAFSYAGTFNIVLTACRDSLPHAQKLAVYCGEALDKLEAALA